MTQIIIREGLIIEDPIEEALMAPVEVRSPVLELLRSGSWHLHDLLGGDPAKIKQAKFDSAIRGLLTIYNNLSAEDRKRGLDALIPKVVEEAHAARDKGKEQGKGVKARTWVKPYIRADGTRVRGYWHLYQPEMTVGSFQVGDLVTVGNRENWNNKDEFDDMAGRIGRVVEIRPDSEWSVIVHMLEPNLGPFHTDAGYEEHQFKPTHIVKLDEAAGQKGEPADEYIASRIQELREEMGKPLDRPPGSMGKEAERVAREAALRPLVEQQRAEIVDKLRGIDSITISEEDKFALAQDEGLDLPGRPNVAGEYVRNSDGKWEYLYGRDLYTRKPDYRGASRSGLVRALTDEEFAAQYRGPLRSALGLGPFALQAPTTEEIKAWISPDTNEDIPGQQGWRERTVSVITPEMYSEGHNGVVSEVLPPGVYVCEPGGVLTGWHRYDKAYGMFRYDKIPSGGNPELVPGQEFSAEQMAEGLRPFWEREMLSTKRRAARMQDLAQALEIVEANVTQLPQAEDYERSNGAPGRLYEKQMNLLKAMGRTIDSARHHRLVKDEDWIRLANEIPTIRAAGEELDQTKGGTVAYDLRMATAVATESALADLLRRIDPTLPNALQGDIRNAGLSGGMKPLPLEEIEAAPERSLELHYHAGDLYARTVAEHERDVHLRDAPDPVSYIKGDEPRLKTIIRQAVNLGEMRGGHWEEWEEGHPSRGISRRFVYEEILTDEEIDKLASSLQWEQGDQKFYRRDDVWPSASSLEFVVAEINRLKRERGFDREVGWDSLRGSLEHWANERVNSEDNQWLKDHNYHLAAGDTEERRKLARQALAQLTERVRKSVKENHPERLDAYVAARRNLAELIGDGTYVEAIQQRKKEQREIENQTLKDVLAAAGVDIGGDTIKLRYKRRSKGAKSVEEASAYLPTSWVRDANLKPPCGVKQDRNARAQYIHGDTIRTDGRLGTSVHELTHHLEYNDNALGMAEWTFWQYRARGGSMDAPLEPFKRLYPNARGKARQEIGVQDRYRGQDFYSGKVYNRGNPHNSWELLTTGIPALWHLEDDAVVWDDPEYRHWLLGVLVGIQPPDPSTQDLEDE